MFSPWTWVRRINPFGRAAVADRPPRRRSLIVAWSLAAVFVLGVGLFRNINLLVLLGCIMVVVPLLNLRAAARMVRGLQARRRIVRPVYAGAPCTVTVQVAPTGGPARLGVRIEDAGPGHALQWFADRLGREGQTFRGRVELPGRGRYAWGPVTATSGYPFGLVHRRRILAPAEEVIVLPRLGRLHRGRFRKLLWSRAADAERRRRQPRRHPAAQDQFHGLRPFRPGDNPRAVHWRTSARRGEWMVREFEDFPGEDLLLIFDPGLDDSHGAADAFEAAVSLAATIVTEWRGDRGGRLIAAVAGPGVEVLDGPYGPQHAERVLERLAVVEPRPATAGPAAAADLLKQLTALPAAAAVVVVAVGRSTLAGPLRQALQRPVVCLTATALRDLDFYEPPEEKPPPARPASGA